jgi:hypothetical protein
MPPDAMHRWYNASSTHRNRPFKFKTTRDAFLLRMFRRAEPLPDAASGRRVQREAPGVCLGQEGIRERACKELHGLGPCVLSRNVQWKASLVVLNLKGLFRCVDEALYHLHRCIASGGMMQRKITVVIRCLEGLIPRFDEALDHLHVRPFGSSVMQRKAPFVILLPKGIPHASMRNSTVAFATADADGFLPLHVAARSDAPLDVVYFLARQGPGAVLVGGRGGGGRSSSPLKRKRSKDDEMPAP